MILRPASEEDLSSLLKIEEECFRDGWGRGAILSALSSSADVCLVLSEDGAVFGWGVVSYVLDQGEINTVGVLPSHRGMGYGKMLLLALMDAAKEKGVKTLFLEVRSSNETAQNLYKHTGFVPYGIRPRYYQNPKEDAILMKTELSSETM